MERNAPYQLNFLDRAELKAFYIDNKRLEFVLGSGTVGLPPLESKVFRATLQATTAVISEKVTIIGTGNFTLISVATGRAWALSPNNWTPIPNGVGASNVEIAFAEPIKPETLENALVVVDAAGNVVPGNSYLLVNLDSTVAYGIGFQPRSRLNGQFTALLKGSPTGVTAVNGNRIMGADYTWQFTLQAPQLFLPLVAR